MQEIDERNLAVSIREAEKTYAEFKGRHWLNHSAIYDLMNLLYTLYWSQIHEYLVPLNNIEGEKEIRRHIKVSLKLLQDCENKINRLQGYKEQDIELLGKFGVLYENLYALVSFRSLEHFTLFMEWDVEDDKKVWKYSMDVLKGVFHYSNKAVLDFERKIKLVMKQMPTGTGKCVDENTGVLTPNGSMKIKDINIGDKVYSMNNNELVEQTVTNKWNTIKQYYLIKTKSGEELKLSPEHKMYTQRGYIQAKDLTIKDFLYELVNGNQFLYKQIKSIEFVDEYIPMVDIEVSETHNFIANGYVSHNSHSDTYIILFIFGVDINNEVIKVVGNPSLINRFSESLVQLMTTKRYAKVFPYFRQFHKPNESVANNMFKTLKIKDGEIAITGSKKPVNFSLFGKDTAFDGVRARFLFLDDICRAKDAGNVKMHDKDIEMFDRTWFKRNYNEHDFVIFVGGTAYSIYDIMSTLKRRYSNNVFVKSPVDRHTHLSEDGKAVFVRVPKLDYETDESLFPRKYSTEEARKSRARDRRTFMAMDQQMPMPPDGTPFYWDNLTKYKVIPEDRPPFTYAVLDPARTGANNNAMGIHIPIEDKDGITRHYLVDCIYEKRHIKEIYDYIIDKIIKHRIIKLVVERNTDTSLKKVLTEKLAERGVGFCEIIEIYTTVKKDVKIQNAESEIRNYIVYPEQDLYDRSSQMGKYMEDIVSFSYNNMSSRGQFDDSIDCEAMYKDHFIDSGRKKGTKSKYLYRR